MKREKNSVWSYSSKDVGEVDGDDGVAVGVADGDDVAGGDDVHGPWVTHGGLVGHGVGLKAQVEG